MGFQYLANCKVPPQPATPTVCANAMWPRLLAASSHQCHRHDLGLGRTSFVLGEPPPAQHWELDFAYFAAFAADRQPVV